MRLHSVCILDKSREIFPHRTDGKCFTPEPKLRSLLKRVAFLFAAYVMKLHVPLLLGTFIFRQSAC